MDPVVRLPFDILLDYCKPTTTQSPTANYSQRRRRDRVRTRTVSLQQLGASSCGVACVVEDAGRAVQDSPWLLLSRAGVFASYSIRSRPSSEPFASALKMWLIVTAQPFASRDMIRTMVEAARQDKGISHFLGLHVVCMALDNWIETNYGSCT